MTENNGHGTKSEQGTGSVVGKIPDSWREALTDDEFLQVLAHFPDTSTVLMDMEAVITVRLGLSEQQAREFGSVVRQLRSKGLDLLLIEAQLPVTVPAAT